MKKIFLFSVLLLMVFSLEAQNCTATDASIWDNTWQSCQISSNPNPARGMGHWIQYQFNENQTLYRTRFWNHNKLEELNKGAKDLSLIHI